MTDELLDFTGQVALITGGSRGLGRQMALALAARGAGIVVTSRKVDQALQRGGEPDEIVGAALYLASRTSSFTTGTLMRVDGGAR